MDEFNLAARFDEDEEPRRSRGKLKRLRPGKTGVGMEKPTDIDIPEDLPEKDEEGPGLDIDVEMEDDDAFQDLVSRMEGQSASAGRAAAKHAKLKGRRPEPRRLEDEDEE